MTTWEETYKDGKFSIDTIQPSIIVSFGFNLIKLEPNFKVADFGAGNGRNSIYAASLGGIVDSVDLADLEFIKNLPEEIQKRITFHKKSVNDFDMRKDYSAIIATRLLQYLSESEAKSFFENIQKGISKKGLAMMSYTASGGIFENEDVLVAKYKHPIGSVERMIKDSGLEIVLLDEGDKISTHTPYKIPNETYEILIKKKE